MNYYYNLPIEIQDTIENIVNEKYKEEHRLKMLPILDSLHCIVFNTNACWRIMRRENAIRCIKLKTTFS